MKCTRLSDYEILEFVGEGSFARVSKVRFKPTGQIYVWKEMDYGKMSDKERQMLVDEVNILRELNHPNIVKYYDRIIDHENKKIYIIQEHCDAGDLDMVIKDYRWANKNIPEDFIWTVLSEVASALRACHQKQTGERVLHRDLKPSNIFLSSLDGRPKKLKLTGLTAKLGDFGLARVLDDHSLAQTHVGTPFYMSPEKIYFKSYDEKSDIWALGCILYEMATLQPPFSASRYTQLARKIQKGEYKDFGNISKDLANLISSMLRVNRMERPTITHIWKLPRVQLITKTLHVERRYLAVKKLEAAQRKKEKEIKQQKTKLTREQSLLNEKKRKLKEQELNLEMHQNHLKEVERYLRLRFNPAEIALPGNSQNSELSDETSTKRSEDSLRETSRVSREESISAFIEAPGGGFLDENVNHQSSVSADSILTQGSRLRSQGYIPSPERPLFEQSNNLVSTWTSKVKYERNLRSDKVKNMTFK